jgi:hypothetical protein
MRKTTVVATTRLIEPTGGSGNLKDRCVCLRSVNSPGLKHADHLPDPAASLDPRMLGDRS